MKRIVVLLIAIALVACFGVACSKTEKTPEPAKEPVPAVEPVVEAKRIHVAVLGKSVHHYWSEVERGVKRAAADLDITAEFFVPNKEDVSQQVTTIENFIAKKVDGIAFAPSDPVSIEHVIQEAKKLGIPAITLDTDAPDSPRVAYIGTNNRAAGLEAGKKMVELLEGKGKIAISTGSLTATNSLARIEGFKEALKGTEIEIVQTLVDNEDPSTALSQAEQLLVVHPDLNGFYGVYGANGPAAAQAMINAGKAGKVKIVCFDVTPEVINHMKAGAIHATIGQRPYMMGYKSVELLNDIAKNGLEQALAKIPADGIIDTGVNILTPESLKEAPEQ